MNITKTEVNHGGAVVNCFEDETLRSVLTHQEESRMDVMAVLNCFEDEASRMDAMAAVLTHLEESRMDVKTAVGLSR